MPSQFELLVAELPEDSYVARRFGMRVGDPETGPVLMWPTRELRPVQAVDEAAWEDLVARWVPYGSVLEPVARRATDQGRWWARALVRSARVRDIAISALIRFHV